MADTARAPRDPGGGLLRLDGAQAQQAVDDGIARYFASRHVRVGPFVDRHFSIRGALALHRHALGLDLVKAPLNLALALPQVSLKVAGAVAGRIGAPAAGRRLGTLNLLLKTRVAAEIEWLIYAELLELPYQWGRRRSDGDALAATILADPRIAGGLDDALAAIGSRASEAAFRRRLEEAMTAYAGGRAAAAEIATGILALGTGAATLKQLTPGTLTLGSALAGLWAQQAAVAGFPLGSTLGGLWYGAFPATASSGLLFGATGGVMIAASTLAAFAGIVADPVQRSLGLHRRRLDRMIDRLERQMADPDAPAFAVRAHYVARLVDLFDLLGAAYRLTRL
jgi:hypothetical protein